MLPLKTPPRWLVYTLSLSIVALGLFTIFGDRGVLHLLRLRDEKRTLDEQNYLLQKENAALRQKITKLRQDDYSLEKLAREELNLVRPGEIIYRFPPADARNDRDPAFSEPPFASRPSAEQK